jgi:kexin
MMMVLSILIAIFFAGVHSTSTSTSTSTPSSPFEKWVVRLKEHVDPAVYAAQNGYTYVGPVTFLTPESRLFIFVHDPHSTRKRGAFEARDVEWSEQQVATRKRLFTRATNAPDPLYASQWHLHTHPVSLNADYAAPYTGRGITIGVVDDGVEHTHPDLVANYDAAHSWDFNDGDGNPAPAPRDGHGTSAAGLAVATALNGHCGRGVAPKARLVGIRLLGSDYVDDLTEAQALAHNGIGVVDVYSCSWGPADTGTSMEAPGSLVEQTLAQYAGNLRGRLGKGSVYVWAAGNGRANGDSCAYDGYASSPYVIPVGALDYNGDQAWFSEGCAALMGVTPSSGAGHGITTTDLTGPAGYDGGECTSSFGGTSASAPMAAGVIALLLEARPELTWRDVKHVIAKGATPVHPEDPDWHINAAGYRHSHKYGFGLLSVPGLITAARAHTLVPPHYLSYTGTGVHFQPPASALPLRATYTVVASGITFIEHVTLTVGVTHEKRGRVEITLESPSGAVSVMAPARPHDTHENYPAYGWKLVSVRHWGETRADGVWIVRANDTDPAPTGRGLFNGFKLCVYGY